MPALGADGRLRRNSRWMARWALLAALCTAVLWGGGAAPEALIAITGLIGVAWLFAVPSLPHKPPRVRFAWLWLALGGFTVLQVVPLPRAIIGFLHPSALTIADAGTASLGLPTLTWLPLALAPGDAALQAALYLLAGAFGVLGSLVVMGSGGRDLVQKLSIAVLGLACVSAFCWLCANQPEITELIPGSLGAELARFTLVNGNHQSGLLNLGVALALGQVILAVTLRWQTVFGLLATFLGLTVLLIGSRGGILVLGIVLALMMLAPPRPPRFIRFDPRDEWVASRKRLLAILLAVLLLGVLLALPVVEHEFSSNTDLGKEAKLQLLLQLPAYLQDNWLVGVAPGSLPVLAGLDPTHHTVRIDFVENIVGQRLVDMGVPAATLFLIGLLWTLRGMAKGIAVTPGTLPFLIAICSVILHNFVDFSMEVAGVLLPLMAVATGTERLLPPPGREDGDPDDAKYKYRLRFKILLGSGVALVLAAAMLHLAWQGLARDVGPLLSEKKPAPVQALIGERFLSNHHAFYLLGRAQLQAGERKAALVSFDRAVALRPGSRHARLFRFATRLEIGDIGGASEDLVTLLHAETEVFNLAMHLVARSPQAEAVLLRVAPRVAELSDRIAARLEATRPDLVERLALLLRERFPGRRFPIEVVRARLYIQRGQIQPARVIAAALLADEKTRLDGYLVEAMLRGYDKKHYEAHHLYREICDKRQEMATCMEAIAALLAAERPVQAHAYIRSRWPHMRDQPNHAGMYWYYLSASERQLGRLDDALESARSAYGLLREEPFVALRLIEALVDVGHFTEARDLLEPLKPRLVGNPTFDRLWNTVHFELKPPYLRDLPPDKL